MQKPKKPPAPPDPAIAEGQARARGRAIADEDMKRSASTGTTSTALYGSEKPTIEKFEGRGDVNVQRRSTDSEETRYQQEAALKGVETENLAKYVLSRRRGERNNLGFARGTETDIADPAGKPRGGVDAVGARVDDDARKVTGKALSSDGIVKNLFTGGASSNQDIKKASTKTAVATVKKVFKKIF